MADDAKPELPETDERPPLLTIAETAPLLRLTADHFRHLIRAGKSPIPVVMVGGRKLFRRTDLERFLKTQELAS